MEITETDRENTFKDISPDQTHGVSDRYVNFIEQTGAKVVPIIYTSDAQLYATLDTVSGVLIPGNDNHPFDKNQQPVQETLNVFKILDQSKKKKDKDNVDFPVFGICFGMEAIALWECQNNDVDFRKCFVENPQFNGVYNLKFDESTSIKIKQPNFYKRFSSKLRKYSKRNIYFHQHQLAITKEIFNHNKIQLNNQDVLAWSDTDNGKSKLKNKGNLSSQNVAIIHHKNQSIIGLQFHPEKNQFNTSNEFDLVFSQAAVKFSQKIATQFIKIAVHNHKNISKDIHEQLIENQENWVNKFNHTRSYIFKKDDSHT